MSTVKLRVVVGVGEEYPGEARQELLFDDVGSCFCDLTRRAYEACQIAVTAESDEVFTWVSVIDGEGDHLFEIEDELTEWLDREDG